MTGVTIELTNEEALLFKQFMQYHDIFQCVLDANVFNVKNGSAIINFKPNGQIQNIVVQQMKYNANVVVI